MGMSFAKSVATRNGLAVKRDRNTGNLSQSRPVLVIANCLTDRAVSPPRWKILPWPTSFHSPQFPVRQI